MVARLFAGALLLAALLPSPSVGAPTERPTFVSHQRCLPHFEPRPHADLVSPDLTFDGPGYDLELGGIP